MSLFERYIYLYQTPIIISGKYRSVWGSHCITVAVSMTVPNVYRDPEFATNMMLPFHWDALIVNDLYKYSPSQASIWAYLNVSKNTNCPISSNMSNYEIFQHPFHTIQFVRWDLTSRQSQNCVRLQHSYIGNIIVHAMEFAVLYSAPSLYAIYANYILNEI